MSEALETLSAALVRATRALLLAMEEGRSDDEIAACVDTQREAFNAFSLDCDPAARLSESVERDIDVLLELDRRIVARARTQGAHLLAQQRKAMQRQNAARAFRSPEESAPRFFNQRV